MTVNQNFCKLFHHKMIKGKFKLRTKENTGSFSKVMLKIQKIFQGIGIRIKKAKAKIKQL